MCDLNVLSTTYKSDTPAHPYPCLGSRRWTIDALEPGRGIVGNQNKNLDFLPHTWKAWFSLFPSHSTTYNNPSFLKRRWEKKTTPARLIGLFSVWLFSRLCFKNNYKCTCPQVFFPHFEFLHQSETTTQQEGNDRVSFVEVFPFKHGTKISLFPSPFLRKT